MGQIRTIDGRYQLEEVISGGAFSTVHLALDLQSQRRVALKIIAPRLRESRFDVFLRLQHEAAILARLNHPAILPVQIGQHEGQFYLVMEYVDAPTLAEILRRRQTLAWPDSLEIVRQVADALSHVHAHGIIHRDLKPSNLLIIQTQNSLKVRLIDFGLAQLRRISYDPLELAEDISGTATYMSPEQSGLLSWPVDGRADLYSLGVVFYELLAGQPPFQADNIRNLLHQHLARRPPALRSAKNNIPPILEQIVLKLLAKNPDERYQTAAGLLADLAHLKNDAVSPFVLGSSDARPGLNKWAAFTGRTREVAELRESFSQLRQTGQGRAVIVSGPSGVGKSRLLETLVEPVAQAGGFFLRGKCNLPQAAVVPLPYKPFGDALAVYLERLQTLPQAERQARREQLRQRISVLGPQIFSVAPAMQALFDNELIPEARFIPEAEREGQEVRFRALLADFILELTKPNQPTVLFLDDLQWADSSSLSLLTTLLARLKRAPLLLALSFRDDAPGVQNLLERNKSETELRHFALKGLALNEMTELLRQVLGPEDNQLSQAQTDLAGRLHHLSQGQPLFVQEALETLVRQGAIKYSSRGWYYADDRPASLILPANAAELLLQRLDSLEAGARYFFACAALLGREFTFEQVRGLVEDFRDKQVIAWLEQGLRENLLIEQPGTYSFSHDRIREAFYKSLSQSEKQLLHEKAGLWLETTQKGNVYDLASHFLQSANHARAAQYAVLAGNEAEQTYSYSDAAFFYSEALSQAQNYQLSATWLDYDQVRENLARVYQLLRHYDQAEELYRQLILEARRTAVSPSRQARYAHQLGNTLFLKGDMAAAVEQVEQALRLLGENRPRTRLGLLWSLFKQGLVQASHSLRPPSFIPQEQMTAEQSDALIIYSTANFVNLYDILRGASIHLRSLNLVERFDMPEERTRLYSEHGLYTGAIGLQGRSKKYLLRAEKLALRYDNKLALVYVYLFRGMTALNRAEYRLALVWLEQSAAMATQLEAQAILSFIYSERTQAYFYLADLPNALATIESIDNLMQGLDDTFDRTSNYMQPSIELLRGNIEQAEAQAQLLLQKVQQAHLTPFEIAMEITLAKIRLDAERWDEARQHAKQALALVRRYSFGLEQLRLVYPLQVETELGDGSSYSPRLAKLAHIALAKTRVFPNHRAYAHRVAGQVAWAAGRKEEAQKYWLKSLSFAQKLGQHYEEARTFYEMGRLMAQATEEVVQAQGRDHLGRALLLFREIKAPRYVEKILRLIVSAPPADDTPDNTEIRRELTRQRQLAGLVEVGRELSAILDTDQLLQRILDVAMEVLGAERGFVLLYDRNGKLTVRVCRTINQEQPAEQDSVNLSIIREAESKRQALLVSDARTDPRFSDQPSIIASEVRSVICVPLIARTQGKAGAEATGPEVQESGKTSQLGFLYADNRLLDRLFGENEAHTLALFAAFAGQAAIALENARLFAAEQAALVELQAKNEKLRRATEMLLDADADLRSIVSEQLHNVLKHRTSQLQAQLQQLAHQPTNDPALPAQVKQMLTTARALSEGLRSVQALVEDAFHRRTLGLIMHLRKTVEDLETLHVESSLRVTCHLSALEELLGPFPERIEETEEGRRLTDLIASAVNQALLNAYDHSQASEVIISTAIISDGNNSNEVESWLSVTIEDNGRGFDPANLPSHTRSLRKLIQKADLLEGKILIESQPGQGTHLELCLPLSKLRAVLD